jgi:membrane-associated phospholipid phosphatase
VILLAVCCAVSGCSSLSWDHVGESAREAATSPWVWGPLAGAAVMQVDSWDEDVSEWARDETPVFGSTNSAQDWSDGLRNASAVGYAASVIATPSRALVGVGAFAVTGGLTEGLKVTTSRERPNGNDDKSLPSGHAANAAVFNTLTLHELQRIDLGPRTRTSLEFAAGAVTAGTAWARVESGDHYPSDVLVGIAVGHFVGEFFARVFPDREPDANLAFGAEPVRDGARLHWEWRF